MEKKTLLNDNFVNLYSVSKTLRFELKPTPKTSEYIERDGIIDSDAVRAENYQIMKGIIDKFHKKFIEDCLQGFVLVGIDEFYEFYRKNKRTDAEEKEFEKLKINLRKQIANRFRKNELFNDLFKKELIKKRLLAFATDESEKQIIESFQDFTTYFTGFHQNRQNMYTDEEKSTAIAYRIVNQNLPRYFDNMRIFQDLEMDVFHIHLNELKSKLEEKLGKIGEIDAYFTVAGFNNVLTQKGISIYNAILGGDSNSDGEKVQGLNEYINLYEQKNKVKLPKMNFLYKQILSDRIAISYIPEQFKTDQEVFQSIDSSFEKISWIKQKDNNLIRIFGELTEQQLEGIYITNNETISLISQKLFGDWSVIRACISQSYDENHERKGKNIEKYEEKKKQELKKVKVYSMAELNAFLEAYRYEGRVEDYYVNSISLIIEQIRNSYNSYIDIENSNNTKTHSLKKKDKDVNIIKQFLDGIIELQRILKSLTKVDGISDKNEIFYGELFEILECLNDFTLLYNKVRNYITSKPYSTEKIKLNFGKSTLLDGWDKSKETENLGIILEKDGLYYLGIINRKNSKCIEVSPKAHAASRYKKMNYKLLPGANKMLPKVFFSKSRIAEFSPSSQIMEIYKKGTFKKGPDFNLHDCHMLIDFFKSSIAKHPEWSQYNFHFSDTETYQDISGFYREVENQGYKITYTEIDVEYIDSLVETGSLYLFQIYNKDFSEYSKGTPNLHTLYWKALFSEENLKDVVYKLNGQAEIFFRKSSISENEKIVHEKNKKIENRDPIGDKKYSLFSYELIKDRRYTCDKYQFHVPITMNFKSQGERKINYRVNREIHSANEMHIIGIDRGERNLLYLSVIDLKGNIKEQMSLNEIFLYDKDGDKHNRDYHRLLVERERENIESRQNWKTINTIKELKEGYLSQVIHVITQIMVEYNAIIVLEDLKFGFKRGRQKFERQVYQKFEKMLIDKLNYMVDKQKTHAENGGLLRAYQLTDKFESFKTMGKQNGFLFYVPAWNTSKIDPTTGFVNLFYLKYESVEKAKEFIRKFKEIVFDEKIGCFKFVFDYSDFTYQADGTQTEWSVYTYGTRIRHFRNVQKNSEWDTEDIDITKEFEQLLSDYGIMKMHDLQQSILQINQKDFYEKFYKLFSLTMQMRNSDEARGIDQMISPVMNKNNVFYESGKDERLPLDADANGAYNIAKKGLLLVKKIKQADVGELEKIKLTISNKEWLLFAQENTI